MNWYALRGSFPERPLQKNKHCRQKPPQGGRISVTILFRRVTEMLCQKHLSCYREVFFVK